MPFTFLHHAIIVIVIFIEFYGGSGMVLHICASVEYLKEGYSSGKYCSVAAQTASNLHPALAP